MSNKNNSSMDVRIEVIRKDKNASPQGNAYVGVKSFNVIVNGKIVYMGGKNGKVNKNDDTVG